jgi:alpha-glucosidase
MPTGRNLEQGSLAFDGVHEGGIKELDVHNLFGTMETKATHDWFIEKTKMRPFIIARSHFSGHGKYGSTWSGDNHAKLTDMAWSIT